MRAYWIALGLAAGIPWLALIILLLRRRVRHKVPTHRQRAIEEIEKAVRDLEGPARVGYLELRRVDPDTIFRRSPGRSL